MNECYCGCECWMTHRNPAELTFEDVFGRPFVLAERQGDDDED